MDNITNKAIIIAVGIFVTIAITSGILTSINEMKNIYQKVYETDTSITSRFSEFDKYDGTEVTGIEFANAVKKYNRDDNNYSNVHVKNDINCDDINVSEIWDDNKIKADKVYTKYKSIVEYKDNDEVIIVFEASGSEKLKVP